MSQKGVKMLLKASESGKYVFLSADSRKKLEGLQKAYGMHRRTDVLTYLIDAATNGLAQQGEVRDVE